MTYNEEKYIDSDGKVLTKKTFSSGNIYYENKQGQSHRLDGPADIWKDGSEIWYKNGLLHRLDGPAIVYSDGTTEYYLEGREASKKEIDLLWLKKRVEE